MTSILGSVVLSTVVSGIIAWLSAKKKMRSTYFMKTYNEERKKIVKLIKDVPDATYEKLKEYVQEIKPLINPLGMSSKKWYSCDSHIWKIIRIIEKSEECIEEKKQVLQMYLTILLEKKKQTFEEEFKENIFDILSMVLYSMSGIFLLISIFQSLYEQKKEFVSALGVGVLSIVGMCMFLFFFKVLLEQVIMKLNSNFAVKYGVLVAFMFCSFFVNANYFTAFKEYLNEEILLTAFILQELGLVFCYWANVRNLPYENTFLQMIKQIEKEFNEKMKYTR